MSFAKLFIYSIIFLLLGGPLLMASPYIQVRIYPDSRAQWNQLQSLNFDEIWMSDNYVDIAANQSQLDSLTTLGFRTDVIIPDMENFYRDRLLRAGKALTMGAYKTSAEIYAKVDSLIAEYPNIVSAKVNIGNTLQGRPMWAVKISDNPNVDENQPRILFFACIHSREVITPEILLSYMSYLTSNYGADSEVTYLVNNREIWFIPLTNPDGYIYNETNSPNGGGMWRKNRRNNGDGSYGVDLNRNFGYEWGYDNAGSSPVGSNETYRGSGPFSEPETQHLRDFILDHDFSMTISYHSYSNLILWPWGYDRIYSPDDDIFQEMGDSAAAFNGFTPTVAWGLYVTNGDTDDWGYGEQNLKRKTYALTLEVGSESDGFWPATNRISTLVSENLQPNLFFTRIVGQEYKLRAPGQPVIVASDTVEAASYDIAWRFDTDTLNPAINYELVELQNRQTITDPAASLDNLGNNQFSISTSQYHSAPSSFYSGSQNNIFHAITTANPHPVTTGDSLKFWTYYNMEADYDYAYVEISTDGINFTAIPGNITTTTNPNGNNKGNGITGNSGGWVPGLFDLSPFVGQNLYFRISYITDGYVFYDGIYVDDFYPVEIFGTENVLSSNITDTTYHITGRAEGNYYYKVRGQDAENQWGRYSEIQKVYAKSSVVCGDANGNESVNILDVSFVINYLYRGGPAPSPLSVTDVNNSGGVNILDVSYLINFLYKGGPAPNCP
ncbi:conserved hypothetical protein [Candidatus Zixiibacteriota bacterium]|nr:conserved hypothetical protein [candidate division Zixibacteria bacterium]